MNRKRHRSVKQNGFAGWCRFCIPTYAEMLDRNFFG